MKLSLSQRKLIPKGYRRMRRGERLVLGYKVIRDNNWIEDGNDYRPERVKWNNSRTLIRIVKK